MPATNSAKFWVICCEENEVTGEIARTVDGWQLPGVRSLIGDRQVLLSQVDAIADSSYVIFVNPEDRPCPQAKVYPLNMSQIAVAKAASEQSPAESPVDMMICALHRHSRSPQSWLLQLPTTEVRAQRTQPVSVQKSVAQAIAAIEVFVRNYTRSTPFAISAQPQPAEPKREVVLTHYRRI